MIGGSFIIADHLGSDRIQLLVLLYIGPIAEHTFTVPLFIVISSTAVLFSTVFSNVLPR